MLSSCPTYFNHDTPEKQCEVIRTYLAKLKDELEKALTEDLSLKSRVDEVNKAFATVETSVTELRDYLKRNYTKTDDIGTWMGDNPTVITDWMTANKTALFNWLTTNKTDFFNWLTQNKTDVFNWLTQNKTDVFNWYTTNKTDVFNWFTTNKTDVINWMTTNKTDLENWFKDNIADFADIFSDYYTDNGIVINNHTYTEQTQTISGTTIHFLGY